MDSELKSNFMHQINEILPGISVCDKIGAGASAVVYKVNDNCLHRDYALKVIQGIKASKEAFKREKDILLTVNHPNVIQLYQLVEFHDEAALLLEYASGGELFDRIVQRTCYSEKDASECIKQILQGLLHLHAKKIVHRDLKPENLLYASEKEDSVLKIADFGLGTIRKDDVHLMHTICGTPGYCAPEILNSKGYDEKVDIWSAGVILYILLCGYEPFAGPNGSDKELFSNIISGSYEFHSPEWDVISDSAKNLIKNMLVVNSCERYSVKECLEHPFISQTNCTDELEGAKEKLHLYTINRKLKKPVIAIAACSAFSKGSKEASRGIPEQNNTKMQEASSILVNGHT